jgi:general stress protein YciG
MSSGISVATLVFDCGVWTGREPCPGAFIAGQEGQVAKEDRGFASMDRNKQREIASKGGKAAHQKGSAHEWTSEEAREAGRKGGIASQRRKQDGGEAPGSSGENARGPQEMYANGSDEM